MITNDIETFYKNMEIHDKRKIAKLEQENKQLKERIEYLERSNNRREDTIIGYRLEDIGIITELEEYLTKIVKNGANIEKLTCSNILVYLKELKEKYK